MIKSYGIKTNSVNMMNLRKLSQSADTEILNYEELH